MSLVAEIAGVPKYSLSRNDQSVQSNGTASRATDCASTATSQFDSDSDSERLEQDV